LLVNAAIFWLVKAAIFGWSKQLFIFFIKNGPTFSKVAVGFNN
jgi:hypothetical protein